MKLCGLDFYNMTVSGASALDNNKEAVNNMNVFPVPDGDTGINMTLTLSTVRSLNVTALSLGEASKKIADAVLRSARGNSGAILSLFFRGMAKAFAGCHEAGAKEYAAAFTLGTKEAYKAVSKPTEGTILTVMRRTAEAAETLADHYQEDLVGMTAHLLTVANDELARTPELLPVLKQAHVVDAGGYGFVTMLEGMLSALQGEIVEAKEKTTGDLSQAADFSQFSTEDVTFAYCTECLVEKHSDYLGEGKVSALYEFIAPLGDSMVFVDDEAIIKLHIHTNNPGKVLEKALEFGQLSKVKIENMRLQHSTKVVEEKAIEAAKAETRGLVIAEPTKKHGFVSVCMGEGIKTTFKDLGVDEIIFGGQTMNPSTQDILDAVYKTPSEIVWVFPNNKNILLVAAEAANLCKEKQIVVVPTRNVPQGISALLVFDETLPIGENLEAMHEAMKNVTCITTTHAVRDSEIDGLDIKNGQAMGLVNEKIKCVADTREACIEKLTEGLDKVSFVTVFYGNEVAEEDAEKVYELLSGHLSDDTEIVLVDGGQGVYDYIISVE